MPSNTLALGLKEACHAYSDGVAVLAAIDIESTDLADIGARQIVVGTIGNYSAIQTTDTGGDGERPISLNRHQLGTDFQCCYCELL